MNGKGHQERLGRHNQMAPACAQLVAAGGPAMLAELYRHMNAKETARFLGLALQTVRDMTARGDLPCVKVGKRGVRYRTVDLIPWSEARSQRVAD